MFSSTCIIGLQVDYVTCKLAEVLGASYLQVPVGWQ